MCIVMLKFACLRVMDVVVNRFHHDCCCVDIMVSVVFKRLKNVAIAGESR